MIIRGGFAPKLGAFVSTYPATLGRVGRIVKETTTDDAGKSVTKTRVQLDGDPGFASSEIEPLDARRSLAVQGKTGNGASAKETSGSLLEGEDRAGGHGGRQAGGTPAAHAKPMTEKEIAAFYEPGFASRDEEQGGLFANTPVKPAAPSAEASM